MKAFDKALQLREQGKHAEAIKQLQQLVTHKSVGQAARYELCLLLHAMGRHKEGDQHAAELSFSFRLNDAIFTGGRSIANRSSNVAIAKVFDNLLPPNLLKGLQDVFAPESDFWTRHEYPTDSFFSYNSPIADSAGRSAQKTAKSKPASTQSHAAKSKALDNPGGLLLQQLAQVLLPAANQISPCVGEQNQQKGKRKRAAAGNEIDSFEFWAHSRSGSCAGHQLHFDLDEIRVQEGLGCPHPAVSCVVYLQGCGGPTLITNLSVDNANEGTGRSAQGWLCEPKVGRVLLFDGSLLHGVVPSTNFVPGQPRTTLMMGLWGAGVRRTPMSAQKSSNLIRLGPNMDFVPDALAGQWMRKCRKGVKGSQISSPLQEEGLIPVGSIWKQIPFVKGTASASKDSGDTSLDIGMFLISQDPANIRDLCLNADAAIPADKEQSSKSMPSSGKVEMISLEELRRLRGEA